MNSNFGGLGSLGGGSGSGLFPSTGVSQNNSGGSFGGFGTNAGLGGTGLGGVGSAGLGGVTGTNGGTNGGVTGTAGTNNTDSAANNKNGGENLVLEEEMDENYEPTDQEIAEYAEWLGMDVEDDKELLWIAKEGLKAPLPNPWKPCQTQEGEIFYFNFESGESVWDHPCDEHYRKVFEEEKKKRDQRKTEEASKKVQEEKEKKEKKKKKKAETKELAPPVVGNTPRGSLSLSTPIVAVSKSLTGKKDGLALESVGSTPGGGLNPLVTPRGETPVLATPRDSPVKIGSKEAPNSLLAPAITLAPARDLKSEFDAKFKEEEEKLEEEFRKKRKAKERELEAEMKAELAEKTEAMQIQVKKEVENKRKDFEKTEKAEFEKWKDRLETEFEQQKRTMEGNLRRSSMESDESGGFKGYTEAELKEKIDEAKRGSREELGKLESELRASKDRERELVGAKNRKAEELDDLEAKVRSQNRRIDDLELQMQRERRELEDSKDRQRSELNEKIFELESRVRSLDNEKRDFEQRWNEQTDRNKRLLEERDLSASKDAGGGEMWERKCRELEEKLDREVQEKREITDAKNKMELEKLRAEQDLENAKRQVESQKEALESRTAEMEAKWQKKLQDETKRAQEELDKFREVERKVKQEIELDFEAEKKRNLDRVRDLEAKLDRATSDLDGVAREATGSRGALDMEREVWLQAKRVLETEKDEADTERRRLEQEKAQLERLQREAEMKIHELQQKIENRESDSEKMANSHNKVVQDMKAAIENVERKEQTTRQELENRLAGKDADLAQHRVDLEKLQNRATEAAAQLDIERSRYKTISQNYEVLMEEKDALLKKLEETAATAVKESSPKEQQASAVPLASSADSNGLYPPGTVSDTFNLTAVEDEDDGDGILFFNNGEQQQTTNESNAAAGASNAVLEADLFRMREENRQMRMQIDKLELDIKEAKLKSERAEQEIKEEKQLEVQRLDRRVQQLQDDIRTSDLNLAHTRARAESAEASAKPLREAAAAAEKKLETLRQEADEARGNFIFRIENLESLLDEEKQMGLDLKKTVADLKKAQRSGAPSPVDDFGKKASPTSGSSPKVGLYTVEDVQREREQGKLETETEMRRQMDMQLEEHKKELVELAESHKQHLAAADAERKSLQDAQLSAGEKHAQQLLDKQNLLNEKFQLLKDLGAEKEILTKRQKEADTRLEQLKDEKDKELQQRLEEERKEVTAAEQRKYDLQLLEQRQKFEDQLRLVEHEKRAALEGASSMTLDMTKQLAERDELEEKCADLQKKHDVLLKKQEQFTEQLEVAQEKAMRFELKSDSLARDLTSREKAFQEQSDELHRKKDDLRRILDEQRDAEVKLRDKHTELLQVRAEFDRERLSLQEEIRRKVGDAQLESKDMQKNVASIESRANTFEDLLQKERSLSSELSVKNLELAKVNTQFQEEVAKLEKQLVEKEGRLAEFENEKATILAQVNVSESSGNKKADELSKKLEKLQREVERLEEQAKKVEKQNKAKLEECEKRLESKHRADKVKASEELRVQYEGKMRDALQEAEERHEKEAKRLEQNLSDARQDKKEALEMRRNSQEEMQNDLAAKHELQETAQKAKAELQKVKADLQARVADMEKRNEQLQKSIEEMGEEVSRLREENAIFLRETENLTEQLDLARQNTSAPEEADVFERRLKEKQTEVSDMKERLSRRDAEVKRLENLLGEKVREKELNIKNLQAQIETLQTQIANFKAKMASIQSSPPASSDGGKNKSEHSTFASFAPNENTIKTPKTTIDTNTGKDDLRKDISELRKVVESLKGQGGIKTSSMDVGEKRIKSGVEVSPNTVVKTRRRDLSDTEDTATEQRGGTQLGGRKIEFTPAARVNAEASGRGSKTRKSRRSAPLAKSNVNQAPSSGKRSKYDSGVLKSAHSRVCKAQVLLSAQMNSLRKIHKILEGDRKKWKQDWKDSSGQHQKKILLNVKKVLDQQAQQLNADVREAKAMEKSLTAKRSRIEQELAMEGYHGDLVPDDSLEEESERGGTMRNGGAAVLTGSDSVQDEDGEDMTPINNLDEDSSSSDISDFSLLFANDEKAYLRRLKNLGLHDDAIARSDWRSSNRKYESSSPGGTRWAFTERTPYFNTTAALMHDVHNHTANVNAGPYNHPGVLGGMPLSARPALMTVPTTSNQVLVSLPAGTASADTQNPYSNVMWNGTAPSSARVPATERRAAVKDAMDFNSRFASTDNDDLWQRWRNVLDTQNLARAERQSIRFEEKKLQTELALRLPGGTEIPFSSVPASARASTMGSGNNTTGSSLGHVSVQMWAQNRSNLREALTSQVGLMRSMAAECNNLKKKAYSARGV